MAMQVVQPLTHLTSNLSKMPTQIELYRLEFKTHTIFKSNLLTFGRVIEISFRVYNRLCYIISRYEMRGEQRGHDY